MAEAEHIPTGQQAEAIEAAAAQTQWILRESNYLFF